MQHRRCLIFGNSSLDEPFDWLAKMVAPKAARGWFVEAVFKIFCNRDIRDEVRDSKIHGAGGGSLYKRSHRRRRLGLDELSLKMPDWASGGAEWSKIPELSSPSAGSA